jgi:hypothetical protein
LVALGTDRYSQGAAEIGQILPSLRVRARGARNRTRIERRISALFLTATAEGVDFLRYGGLRVANADYLGSQD